MREEPSQAISLTHDAAIVIAGLLADHFYAGSGPLNGRLTRAQDFALSELLMRLEKCGAISPITLGPEFLSELKGATQRIEAADRGDAAP
jgi:hypothetical protein